MAGTILELRVHGVSNTPPASMLGTTDQKLRLVAGDATTGFYRSGEGTLPTLEAYSWGQLTSGQRAVKDIQRALWTLLLPFTLANVALHARPNIPADSGKETFRSGAGFTAWLIRVFSLTLTATLVLAATGVGVDLVGWQCVDTNCLSVIPGPWEFLASPWWRVGGRAMVVGLLAPFGLLGVVGLLSWRSYQYEAVVPTHDPAPEVLRNPLQRKDFWCGERQLRRLAVLHLTTGISVALAVPFGVMVFADRPAGPRVILAIAVGLILLAIPALAIVSLGQPSITDRGTHSTFGGFYRSMIVLAMAGCLGSVWYLLLPTGNALNSLRPNVSCHNDGTTSGCSENRSLPGFDKVILWLALVQVVLLLVIALMSRRPKESAEVPVAWAGRGPAVLAGLGWMLGLAYSCGVLYWVTDLLNRGAAPTGASPITLPLPVMWSGLGLILAVLVIVAGLGCLARLLAKRRREELPKVVGRSPDVPAHDARRGRQVATFRALHLVIRDNTLRVVGLLFCAAILLAVAGTVASFSGMRPVPTSPSGWQYWIAIPLHLGDTLAGFLPLLIAVLGLQVYRSDRVRRSIGVVWDVGTFWPRSGHPFAPPSYAERAVPELQTRIAGLRSRDTGRPDWIILSGHSQGAVIGAAAILQLPAEFRDRVWFFSYGCQLTRLYGRVFPAYFAPERLAELSELLRSDPEKCLRWTNFWRPTDPIGWQVAGGQEDVEIKDPTALRPSGGEVIDPPIHNHSGYPLATEFTSRRAEVCDTLSPPGRDYGAPLPVGDTVRSA